MQLKRLYEVTIAGDIPRHCTVIDDDEDEIAVLLPDLCGLAKIKPLPGLVAAEGGSRILSWVHFRGFTPPPAARKHPGKG